MLYPLIFQPIIKPKIWGREIWTISALPPDESTIINGFLQDNTLQEIVEVYLDELLGQHVFDKYRTHFPLLVKIIDAEDNLSVQVHPSDAYAHQHGLPNGKTEMWYVRSENADGSIIVGWQKPQNADTIRASLQNDTILDLLQKVPVQRDDVAYIPAGLVHSLQKNTSVIEIQESSDTTFRLYDYNRVDAKGNRRPLHIEQAVECLNFDAHLQPLTPFDKSSSANLVNDPHFITRTVCCTSRITRYYTDLDSFVAIIPVEGEFDLIADKTYKVSALNHIIIPANLEKILIQPTTPFVRFLEVYIP